MKANLSIQHLHRSNLFIAHKANSSQRDSVWLDQVNHVIESSLGKSKITISFLAKELFTSERQLYRRLKKQTGKTPNEYLQAYKLKKARQLIHSGQSTTLKAICAEIGFKRVDYFSRLFEERFGVRPVDLLEQW